MDSSSNIHKKANILIAEDESIIAADLEKLLKKLNYDVVGTEITGEGIISAALEKKPDLILMDIYLEGEINGIEAAQQIKDKIDIPIIYLTAYGDENTIEKAQLTDPFGYILKPFDEVHLNSAIQIALQKHEANNKLKESEARYRALVEMSPIAIGIHCEGKVVYSNSAGVKLFGAKSANDLIGKPVMELVIPNFRDVVEERIKRVTNKKEILEPLEEKLRRIDGKEIDVEVTAIPTTYEGKDAVQVIIRDISEIKKRERIQQTIVRILQSVNNSESFEQQLNYLFKTLIDYIENKNLCFAIYDKSKNFISFPIYSDEFDQKPANRQFNNELIEYAIKSARIQLLNSQAINELISCGEIQIKEKIPKVWLGVPIELSDYLTLVIVFKEYLNENYLSEKEVELLNAIILPLTRAIERKMIENEKNEALQKLEEMNKTKDNFFSILSHDLRSPFDSILGFTEILKNELDLLTKQEIQTYLDSLYQSSRHIYNLLNNLLHYSRFQLGKTDYNPKNMILTNAVNKTIEILRGNALKKEIKIFNNVEKDIVVLADDDMLDSILMNLITNAIKFTKSGGEIIISANEKINFIEISIKDNGIGMDNKTMERLFKLDYNKSTPGTENETGSGLGLLIVKQYVERHGGSISVQSELAKGTTIRFTIPKA